MMREVLIDTFRHRPAKRTMVARRALKAEKKPRSHTPLLLGRLWIAVFGRTAARPTYRMRVHKSMFRRWRY